MKLSNTLSLLLFSSTCKVAVAGNGGGEEAATTAPPVIGEGCIQSTTLAVLDIFGSSGCNSGTSTYEVEGAVATTDTCPDPAVKLCFDMVGDGDGIDFQVPGTCDALGSNFFDLSFDYNDLATAVGFSVPGGPIEDCDDPEAELLEDFVLTSYVIELLSGWVHICPTTSICPNVKQREPGRRLNEDHQDFYTIVDKCGTYEYEGSLFVADHLFALGVPGEEAKKHGCPYVAVHSIVGDRNNPMSTTARKEILLWDNQVDFEKKFPSEGNFSFGEFSLNDLVKAYLKADVSSNKNHVSVYDVIGNSCGHFIVSLAGHLGIKIDADVTTFVARRLMEKSGKDLIEKIRSSALFPSLLKDSGARRLRSDATKDDEIVTALVETTAMGIMEN